MLSLFVLLISLLLESVLGEVVTVTPSSEECGPESEGSSIDEALHNFTSNDTIVLMSGCHKIQKFVVVQGLSNIEIVGESNINITYTRVTCESGMGLAFYNITNLTISDVEFTSCSLIGDENLYAAIEMANQTLFIFYQAASESKVGIFMADVKNLHLANVNVTNTQGIGMLAINIMGSSVFEEVRFLDNRSPSCNITAVDDNSVGGGLLLFYTDYHDGTRYENELNELVIDFSLFNGNQQCSLGALAPYYYEVSPTARDFGFQLVGGGGLGIIVASLNFGISIDITDTSFHHNSAIAGGGAYVVLFVGVSSCNITFTNCTFMGNTLDIDERDSLGSNVAAMTIITNSAASFLYIYREMLDSLILPMNGNTVTFNNSTFVANTGSGLHCTAFPSPFTSYFNQDVLSLKGCTFSNNNAIISSPAISANGQKFSGSDPGIQLYLHDVIVENNRANTQNSGYTGSVIVISSINITFTGRSIFRNNMGSCLLAETTIINFAGSVSFENNSAYSGAAMQILVGSAVVIKNNSHLSFVANRATVNGGAINVNLANIRSASLVQNCFLYFNNYAVVCGFYGDCTDPATLNFSISFKNNHALLGSAVYGSTLDSCTWSEMVRSKYGQKNDNFIFETLTRLPGSPVTFDPPITSRNVINTLIVRLALSENDPISTPPGETIQFNVAAEDALNQSVPIAITSQASNTLQSANTTMPTSMLGLSGYWFLNGNGSTEVQAVVQGSIGSNVSVILSSSLSSATVNVHVDLTHCNYGFVYDNSSCQCLMLDRITCNQSTGTLTVDRGYWVGRTRLGNYTITKCIFDYCTSDTSRNVRGDSTDSLCNFNRAGVLCGGCQDGYSSIYGSRACQRCNNNAIPGLVFAFLFMGIVTVMSVAFLNFTIAEGYLNGIIFYCNVLGYIIPIAAAYSNTDIFIIIALVNYSTGVGTCIYDGMDSLARVGLSLLFPWYVFILMLCLSFLIGLTKWRHKNTVFSSSRGFATLLLLSYSSVSSTCIEILAHTTIEKGEESYTAWKVDPNISYGEGVHGFLIFVAITFLLAYIIPLTLILLVCPLLEYSEKGREILDKINLKLWQEAFFNPLKEHCHIWIGLRCIERIIINLIISFSSYPQNAFGTLVFLICILFVHELVQPFKKDSQNRLESFYHLNILFLSLTVFIAEVFSGSSTIIAIFLTLSVYIVFAGIILVHIHLRFPSIGKRIMDYLCCKSKCKKQDRYQTEPSEPGIIDDCEDLGSHNIHVQTTYSELQNPPLTDEFIITNTDDCN